MSPGFGSKSRRVLALGLASMAAMTLGTAAAAYDTGVYVGGPNGNDPAAMARFKQAFDAHVAALDGRRPKFFNVFTDFRKPTEQWISSANWGAWSAKRSGKDYYAADSGMIPVVGVPLASGSGGWGKVDTFYQETIAGKYDAVWNGIVDAWADNGYKIVDFRIAYEMNGNFMPWAPGNSKAPDARTNFVAAFRHVADIIHARARTKHIQAFVHWNPCAINNTSFDVQALYPGDDYVDVISTDVYSPMYPLDLTDWSTGGTRQLGSKPEWAAILANRQHFWRWQSASNRIKQPGLGNWGWSVEQTIAMAKLHNKPLGFDEAGSGAARGALGEDDEPEFPRFLARTIARIEAQGIPVRNVNIWDTKLGDGDWEFKTGRKPMAAKMWAACFGTKAPAGKASC